MTATLRRRHRVGGKSQAELCPVGGTAASPVLLSGTAYGQHLCVMLIFTHFHHIQFAVREYELRCEENARKHFIWVSA